MHADPPAARSEISRQGAADAPGGAGDEDGSGALRGHISDYDELAAEVPASWSWRRAGVDCIFFAHTSPFLRQEFTQQRVETVP
jgi:hypothetical protein